MTIAAFHRDIGDVDVAWIDASGYFEDGLVELIASDPAVAGQIEYRDSWIAITGTKAGFDAAAALLDPADGVLIHDDALLATCDAILYGTAEVERAPLAAATDAGVPGPDAASIGQILDTFFDALDDLLAEHFAEQTGGRPWPVAIHEGMTDAEAVAYKGNGLNVLRHAVQVHPLTASQTMLVNEISASLQSLATLEASHLTLLATRVAALASAFGVADVALPKSSACTAARANVIVSEHVTLSMASTASPIRGFVEVSAGSTDLRGAMLEVQLLAGGRRLTRPYRTELALSPGESIRLDTDDLPIDGNAIWSVTDVVAGSLEARVIGADGTERASNSRTITVLGPRTWHRFDSSLLPWEVLAAHVQPHSPAIQSLLPDVQRRLQANTGDGSIAVYQSDDPANASRVDDIVRAAFEVVRARNFGYSEPPASWSVPGQLVRTPEEVLDARLATCMDSTILFASVLEALDVAPLLVAMPGHIFVGYWRSDAFAPSAAIWPSSLSALGTSEIGLIESTKLSTADGEHSFAAAQRAGEGHLGDAGTAALTAIVDVRVARMRGVRAMPARVVAPDGAVTIVEYTGRPGRSAIEFASDRRAVRTTAPARVERWKSSLLDLSLRNRLINYAPRSQTPLVIPRAGLGRLEDALNSSAIVPITHDWDFDAVTVDRLQRRLRERDMEGYADTIQQAVAQRFDERMTVVVSTPRLAEDDRRDPVTMYATKMRKLTSEAQRLEREAGTNNLYVSFGMLRWDIGGKRLESPLVLVPVRLTSTHRGTRFKMQIDESGASTPNFALLEKLKVEFDLELPGLAEPTYDAAGIDLAATFASVRASIANRGLDFAVDEVAAIGLLAFGTYRLWKDVADHWEQFSQTPVVKHLIETPTEEFRDPVALRSGTDLDELGLLTPIPADGSQLEAVADAVHGTTFVLEGPPGTGKSQTIVNLVAQAMTVGKRVLFVAEKADALEVVDQRLRASGLDALTLNLHHDDAKPKQVKQSLLAALELAPEFDADGLETRTESARASQRVLQRYARTLHEPNAASHSMYSAHNRVLAARELGTEPMALPRDITAVPADRLQSVRVTLGSVGERMLAARPSAEHPWSFLTRPSSSIADVAAAAIALDEALNAASRSAALAPVLPSCGTRAQLAIWRDGVVGPAWNPDTLVHIADPQGIAAVDALRRDIAAWADAPRPWRAQLSAEVVEQDLLTWQSAAAAARTGNIFSRKRRQREAAAVLQPWQLEATEPDAAGMLDIITALVADRGVLEDLRRRIAALPIGIEPSAVNPLLPQSRTQLDEALERLGTRLLIVESASRDSMAAAVLASGRAGRLADDASLASAVEAAWHRVEHATGRALDPQHEPLRTWAWLRLRSGSPIRDGAHEWDDLLAALEPLLEPPFDGIRARILAGELDPDTLTLEFDHGVAEASAHERFEATRLGAFDRTTHHAAIDRFVANATDIRGMLPQRIPAAVVEHRTFHAGAQSGRIGELRRKLGKQRGGETIRELFASHGDLITQITPCVLTSPDGAARFLPANADLFDIVVFDEASQIKVANAIGALGRAKVAVVVGDSKQMPPTSMFDSAVAEDEADSSVVADEESILRECVQANIPRRWLTWHYRSKDETLIAFSNEKYYESKLASFPSPIGAEGSGLSLRRVDGTFDRSTTGTASRTNSVEAAAIVAEIEARYSASPDEVPSIGVITLNIQQRELIRERLLAASDARIAATLEDPDDQDLWVLNLESVQGKEADLVLFSIAFSRDAKGKVPLTFGPMNLPGAERRLNVAVTRARTESIVFCSFEPAELQARQPTSLALQHLADFLVRAQGGASAALASTLRKSTIDRHRDDVAQALRDRGMHASIDVGLSDFRVDVAIADPDDSTRQLVAVLLDGPGWHQRKTVNDRDGLPISVLRGAMGWPAVERVWLADWLRDRDAVLDRLVSTTKDAAAGKAATRPLAASGPVHRRDIAIDPTESPTGSVEAYRDGAHDEPEPRLRAGATSAGSVRARTAAEAMLARHASEFAPWNAEAARPPRYSVDDLPNVRPHQEVSEYIEQIVSAEGPVSYTRVARLVGDVYGLGRVTAGRQERILRCVPSLLRRSGDTDFAWPRGADPGDYTAFRTPADGESRSVQEIAPEEIANAMAVVASRSGGATGEELVAETLGVFGGRRLTTQARAALERGLDRGLSTGRLRRDGELVHATWHGGADDRARR
ncbi:DUF3320 domain-containing protein [Agrococcus jejuensis]|uniref:DUF3320 domain-containing protein n=1 Tax=Agrococcus jejuensis TaxID=399736 RepID=UPI0016428C7F|nr:DUF3320 domain-containing protein [Agrococcus jejuensis]